MVEMLDLKDKKILFELEQDCRQSLNKIAVSVGLKKETLFHRIKSLERQGIIKSYLTEIDIYKLGFQFYPVLVRFQNTTPTKELEIFNYLKNSSFTSWLTRCEGAWDINLTLVARTNFELNTFLEDFLGKYSLYIADKQIFITTEVHYFKKDFWIDKKPNQTITTGGESKTKVDELDLKILKVLSNNARKSLVEIGKAIETNPKNIAYRIKKLEKEKIIQGSRILVDFSKIGCKFYKVWFSLKNLSKENSKKLMAFLKSHPNIIWATKLIGFYDFSIEIEVKDVQEFRRVLDDIKSRFSQLIKKHESLLIFEESTMEYLPNM